MDHYRARRREQPRSDVVHLGAVLVPLFLGASILVGLAGEYHPPERIERTLRGYNDGSGNVAAAVLGAVTPFCSCSTVPMLTGLLQALTRLGMAMSFLLASPLVNEMAVLFLLGVFGLEVTVWYVLATVIAAVVGGIVVGRLASPDQIKDLHVGAEGNRALATHGGTPGTCGCDGPTAPETHRVRVLAAAGGRGRSYGRRSRIWSPA